MQCFVNKQITQYSVLSNKSFYTSKIGVSSFESFSSCYGMVALQLVHNKIKIKMYFNSCGEIRLQ